MPVLDDDCDGQLGAGCCTSGAWTKEVVDPNGTTGAQSHIGVDAQGNASIGYSELTQTSPTSYEASARFAHKPRGGIWSTETVSAPGDPATSVAFSLDPAGVGHEVYRQGTGTHYAIRASANNWTTFPGPGMGQSASTVLHASGAGDAHLAWRAQDGIWYALLNGATTKEMAKVSSSGGQAIHFAAHESGKVYVMHPSTACSGCSIGALVLYTKQPGGFSTLSLGTSTGYAGIAVDSAGDPHVAMTDAFGHFEYGSKKPGTAFSSAQCYTCPDPGSDIALAIDGAGQAHAAYVAGSTLRYYRRVAGDWQSETIAVGVMDSADVSLALDSGGGVHVSYQDGSASSGQLAYAYRCP